MQLLRFNPYIFSDFPDEFCLKKCLSSLIKQILLVPIVVPKREAANSDGMQRNFLLVRLLDFPVKPSQQNPELN